MRAHPFSIAGFSLLTAALLSTAAQADEVRLRGSLAAQSDYRFRGISQTDRQIAPQASLTVEGPDGWYAGTWASRLRYKDGADTTVEWDIYAGKRFKLGENTELNIQPYYYAYPDHDEDVTGLRYSYFELITGLTHKFGDLTLGVMGAYSPEWFAESGTGWWLAGSASYTVTDWLSLSGNLGRQWAHGFNTTTGAGFPYYYWDAGFTATWRQFAFDVRYIDTDLSKDECGVVNGAGNANWCSATVVGTLTWSFDLI
jgi:uncharacterized protein (TIGR02001 family)